MKLGFLTAAFPDLSLEEIAAWAASEGFETLEIACWPAAGGERRRYAGVSHIDVESFDAGAVRELFDKHELEISSLAYYPNNLHADDDEREAANAHLLKVVDAAQALGVKTVGTFVGNDKDRPYPENLERFKQIWPPLVAHAEERGVRIAIENCPMIFSWDEWPGGNNLAATPAAWDDMFEAMDDGRQPMETFYDGYVVNAIIDACYRSAESRTWEPVRLEDWRGTGAPRIAPCSRASSPRSRRTPSAAPARDASVSPRRSG